VKTVKSSAAAPLDRSLTYRLHLLHKISDQVSHQAYLETVGLSMSDGRCLATVGSFEPLSVNQLAERSNLNKSQASRASQYLVDQGLLEKQGHPEDGRGVLLSLTPRGRTLWLKAMKLIAKRNQDIFGCLDDQERAVFSHMLDRLVAHNQLPRRTGRALDPDAPSDD